MDSPEDGPDHFTQSDIALRPGEAVILNMADSSVLDTDDNGVTLEDKRLSDISRYHSYSQIREASKNPLDYGARMESDDTTILSRPIKLAAGDSKPPNVVRKIGFKKRAVTHEAAPISWDKLFKQDIQLPSVPQQAFSFHSNWKEPQDEEEETLGALDLIKNGRLSTRAVVLETVAEDQESSNCKADLDVDDSLVMSRTHEFTRSLPDPSEIVKASETQRKGVISVVANESSPAASAELTDKLSIDNVLEETNLEGGLGSALKFLRFTGTLDEDKWNLGRTDRTNHLPLNKLDKESNIKLDYTNPWGQEMSPKEAFRRMSYRFHGKVPGKNKQEKLLKRMVIGKSVLITLSSAEKRRKAPSEMPATMIALEKQQKESQKPYLVLNSTTRS